MQSRTVTLGHGVTRKRKKKDRKGYKKAIQKESKEKRCLLTPDVKSF